MPLYEYQCGSCGSVFEVMQKFSDQPLAVHENCGGAVQRLLSAPALQFKGSGWYITDYARAGSSGGPNGKTETKSGEGDSKSESKKTTDSSAKTESSSSKKSSDAGKPSA
jgi:putative FmdB family regulatory protein